MPQNDRHRPRVVPIEFNASEDLKALPLAERTSIIIIMNGSASLYLNGKAVLLTAPCVMLLSQYDSIKLIEATKLDARAFHFNPVFINSALTFERLKDNDFIELEDEHDCNMMNLFLERDEYYEGAMDLSPSTYLRIIEWLEIIGTEVYAQSDGYWTCRIRRYLLQTLYLLDDIYMDRKTPYVIKHEKSPTDLLVEYIHINYSNDISLDDLCKLVHLNRTSLNQKFKEKFGATAMEYLLKHRIKIACETLTHTNLCIAEIAEAVGFTYDTYFIKQFIAKMGQSPTEYRHSIWNERKNNEKRQASSLMHDKVN